MRAGAVRAAAVRAEATEVAEKRAAEVQNCRRFPSRRYRFPSRRSQFLATMAEARAEEMAEVAKAEEMAVLEGREVVTAAMAEAAGMTCRDMQ